MERGEKKRLRDKLSEHIDISATRLSDDKAQQLSDLVDNYDSHAGTSRTQERKWKGFSSEGYYWRRETITDTFMEEEIGIRRQTFTRDDDGTDCTSTEEIRDGRGILNWLRDHR